MGATSGDWSEAQHSLPLLFPGGVGGFRLAGLLPEGLGPLQKAGQSIAHWADRSYADYRNPRPDGRIPVYSGKGTLKGYFTRWEIVKAGLGWRGGPYKDEQDLVLTLVKQRDQINEYRRSYLESLFQGDPRSAQKTAEEFSKRYGFSLPIDSQSIKAMQTRKSVTRLERLAKTVPAGPARDQIIQMISAYLGASGQSLLGVDPALLGATRSQGPRRVPRRLGPYQQNMGPMDEVAPGTLGRRPYPSLSPLGA